MTQNKRVIAVTGGIGSGKSSVCEILAEYGDVLSCDKINAELLCDESYLEKLRDAFPFAFTSGALDKKALARIVFSDEISRNRLNELAHPEIMNRLLKKIEECTHNVVFVEVPLLSGTAFEKMFSEIIVVTSDRATRIRRVMLRDKVDVLLAEQKLNAQTDKLSFPSAVVYTIDNSGTKKELKVRCKQLIKTILS